MINKLPTIYIGYDPKEESYVHVLKKSIEDNTNMTYNIVPLVQKELRRSGLYYRTGEMTDYGRVDCFDGKPFSTEFSFTRFLVPFLNQFSGLALFMDCDMFVRSDISEIFDTYGQQKNFPISCIHHDHAPIAEQKMDGQIQTIYRRKNWSSFVLWNCDHPALKHFTVADVNTKSGSWLHAFEFIDYDPIGEIHPEWNWLDSHSPAEIEAKCVHFTTGGPVYPDWKGMREIDNQYAEEWKTLYKQTL